MIFVLSPWKRKAKKENLLLTHYSHFQPALEEEVKNIAKFFCTYFESNKLKNETRGLATNVTTGYNVL